MNAAGLAAMLGGREVLGREIRTDLELADVIHEGLPISAVEAVLASGLLAAAEVDRLVVPRRTLARRKRKALSTAESDRLTRAARVLSRAGEALGSTEAAGRWMRKPNRALRGARPIQLLGSDVGCRLVEKILGRVEHGVYS